MYQTVKFNRWRPHMSPNLGLPISAGTKIFELVSPLRDVENAELAGRMWCTFCSREHSDRLTVGYMRNTRDRIGESTTTQLCLSCLCLSFCLSACLPLSPSLSLPPCLSLRLSLCFSVSLLLLAKRPTASPDAFGFVPSLCNHDNAAL